MVDRADRGLDSSRRSDAVDSPPAHAGGYGFGLVRQLTADIADRADQSAD